MRRRGDQMQTSKRFPPSNGADFDTNCGNYRKEEFHNVVHHVEGELQLKLGMIVLDECEAYNLYNEYALQKGFSIRRDQKRYKSGTKEIRERTFVCSKQGFQDCNPLEVKAYDGLTTRTGCVAHVTFKIENGIWEIIKLNDEHNHGFALPGQRHLLRSGRKMFHVTKDVVKSSHSAGVGPTKAHAFVAQEVGGYENVEGTKRDFQNFVHRTKLNLIGAGDAQALINHFKIKQASDPMFFYSVQLDDENRLTNIFWRDGVSKLDYEVFGDVVIFDTTFRTNKYNLVCAPFVGVNHHWQNTLFGCAFLVDESTISFVWLFETFLHAMDNKQPNTIFTDQDHAITSAIKTVFTNASHRLCQWHIHKNAAQRIPHLYGKAEFKKKFYKCFVGCQTEEEFESTWKEMVEEWSATENSWLRKLYEIREKWCPVFSNDCFLASMKSSQRSESTNNIFHEMSCKTMSLMEFAVHYDKNSEKMRAHAKEQDFRSAQGKPRVYIPSGILIHAADIYTCKVFRMFQEEFFQSVTQKVIDHVHDGLVDCYRLKKEDSEKVHTVWFNTSTFTITCSCKKFESLGLLCCHALRIFNVTNNDGRIPSKYIAKRWTKGVKEITQGDSSLQSLQGDVKESKTILFSKLMHNASKVINLAAFDGKSAGIFQGFLEKASEGIKKYMESIGQSTNVDNNIAECRNPPTSTQGQVVLNPPRLREKGVSNARIKSFHEKRGCKMGIKRATSQSQVKDTEIEHSRGRERDVRPTGELQIERKKGIYVGVDDDDENSLPPNANDDGLGDIWTEMAFVMESSKDAGVDTPPDEPAAKYGEACDHSFILKDDIGYVCRVCGIIQKSIDTIIEYQFTNARNSRTNWYEGRTSKDPLQTDYIPGGLKAPSHDFVVADISAHPRHSKQMKPHQIEGFNFLLSNLVTDNPGGCIMAHAPGSGKTFMIISFLQSFMAKYPFARPLVVLPRGILATWKKEFQRWQVEDFPLYDFYSVKADSRAQQLEVLKQWAEQRSILFLGYKQFSSIVCDTDCTKTAAACQEILLTCPSILILDEGHTPRNKDTDVLTSLEKVQTPRKVVLSGTLYQNHVKEIFNILNLVRPKFLGLDTSKDIKRRILSKVSISSRRDIWRKGSENEFYEVVEHTLLKDKDFKRKVAVIQDLREMTRKVLHYYKGDFLDELPGLVDFTVLLRLSPKQQGEVADLKKWSRKFKISSEGSAIYVHPQLKSLSNNPVAKDRVDEEKIDKILEKFNEREGVKAKFYLNLLQLCESKGEKLLVFSQFLLPLKFLERLTLKIKGYSIGKEIFMITGDSDNDEREISMERFNTSSDARVFFGSIRACGEGISLIGASRVVILDVHLNPSVTRQAIGRAFRPGQERKVYVYRLVAAASPEQEDHATCFRKESIAKIWFEWNEFYGYQDFEMEAVSVSDCEDHFLETPRLNEDVISVYKR